MRRHPAPLCEWKECERPPAGFRMFWRGSTLFRTWLCRRHQRQWDRGTRRKGRYTVDADA